jgi:hypothetical protein
MEEVPRAICPTFSNLRCFLHGPPLALRHKASGAALIFVAAANQTEGEAHGILNQALVAALQDSLAAEAKRALAEVGSRVTLVCYLASAFKPVCRDTRQASEYLTICPGRSRIVELNTLQTSSLTDVPTIISAAGTGI